MTRSAYARPRWNAGAVTLFIGLSTLFVVHSAQFFDFVPFWDGWEFFRNCYQSTARDGNCYCYGHSSAFNSVVFASALRLMPGAMWPVYVMSIVIGLIGIVAFYYLVTHLLPDQLTNIERVLIAFIFGLNPVFHAQVIQPSLDFALPVYLTLMLLCLFKQRFVFATVAGVMLVFTKEPGIMFYGLAVSLYAALNWVEWRRWVPRLYIPNSAWSLLVPIALFGAYALCQPPQKDGGAGWGEVIAKLCSLDFGSAIARGQLASLLVLNFSWLLVLPILVMAAAIVHRVLRRGAVHRQPPETIEILGDESTRNWVLILALFLLGTFFMTRVVFVNNPRYVLPLLPLLVLLFAKSISELRFSSNAAGKAWRVGFTAVTLLLVHASSYRTIDPVSKIVFGTFYFGEHEMLRVATPECEVEHGYGRDQLVYNSEFTQLHYLTERAVRRFGLNQTYVTDPRACWTEVSSFCTFDPMRQARTVGEPFVEVDFRRADQVLRRPPSGRVFFVDFPQMPGDQSLAALDELYKTAATHFVHRNGYAIRIVELERRDMSVLATSRRSSSYQSMRSTQAAESLSLP